MSCTDDQRLAAWIREAVDSPLRAADPDVWRRRIWTIAEIEMHCDMDGIDSFVDKHGAAGWALATEAYASIGASALAGRLAELHRHPKEETLLAEVNQLVTERAGYTYESLCEHVHRAQSGDLDKG